MNKNFLKYLENIVSLEKELYTQKQVLNNLKNQIRRLGYHQTFERPSVPAMKSFSFSGLGSVASFGGTIGFIVGLFVGNIVWSMVIGAVGLFSFFAFFEAASVSSDNKERNRNYDYQLERYHQAVRDDLSRVENEIRQKGNMEELVKIVEKKINGTQKALDQFYSANIIFPKYRNLISMCSIYEYFMAGRCESLTGHEGAYNIYESEVRLNAVLTKLDEIVVKLEDIKNNQYVLYDTIREGNQMMNRLVQESAEQTRLASFTAEKTAIAAYYAEQTAQETKKLSWYQTYDHLLAI